jgi:hypothetical protein
LPSKASLKWKKFKSSNPSLWDTFWYLRPIILPWSFCCCPQLPVWDKMQNSHIQQSWVPGIFLWYIAESPLHQKQKLLKCPWRYHLLIWG